MIKPYDLGNLQFSDNVQKIHIDKLVKQAKRDFKIRFIETNIEALGVLIKLTTSKTRFDGERLWFVCPICSKKVGTLYRHDLKETIGCRNCLEIKYKKQRYKGMVEQN